MNTALDVQITLTQKSIVLGETLEFSLTLHSHEDQQLLIDYCLGYQKANAEKALLDPIKKPANLNPIPLVNPEISLAARGA